MPPKVSENLADHTRKLYAAMLEASRKEEVQNQTYDVFRGSIVKVYTDLGISRSYYSRIVAYLSENGCISFLQKGGRSVDSVIVLHDAPVFEGSDLTALTGRGKSDRVEKRLKTLEDRLGGLDIARILVELDRRLKKLEGKAYGKITQG